MRGNLPHSDVQVRRIIHINALRIRPSNSRVSLSVGAWLSVIGGKTSEGIVLEARSGLMHAPLACYSKHITQLCRQKQRQWQLRECKAGSDVSSVRT